MRAVGMANGSNAISIIVPCHRVIGANASLTGYGGASSGNAGCCGMRAPYRGNTERPRGMAGEGR